MCARGCGGLVRRYKRVRVGGVLALRLHLHLLIVVVRYREQTRVLGNGQERFLMATTVDTRSWGSGSQRCAKAYMLFVFIHHCFITGKHEAGARTGAIPRRPTAALPASCRHAVEQGCVVARETRRAVSCSLYRLCLLLAWLVHLTGRSTG